METVFIALRVALSLGVVLALLWVLQRKLSTTGRAKRTAGMVNVVTRQGISPKASVVVVDVDGTRFLLGVTESAITVLHSTDAPAAEVHADAEQGLSLVPATAGAFAASLSAAGAAPASASAPASVPVSTSAAVPASAPANAAGAAAAADDAAYRRPRARDRKPAGALDGSVLSVATWRQAGAALRQRRAG